MTWASKRILSFATQYLGSVNLPMLQKWTSLWSRLLMSANRLPPQETPQCLPQRVLFQLGICLAKAAERHVERDGFLGQILESNR